MTTKWKLSPADQNGYAGQNGPTSGGLILFTTAVINILSWILGQLYMFFLVRKNVSWNFKYMLYFDWLSAQNNEFCLYYGFFGIQTYGFLLWSYNKINVNLWKIDFFENLLFFSSCYADNFSFDRMVISLILWPRYGWRNFENSFFANAVNRGSVAFRWSYVAPWMGNELY